MRFVFFRHPVFLLSVSPLLYGYLTVAAGFLIAHVFLSASSFLTSVFAGCFMAGTFLGSLLIGRYADRYGRSFFCRTLLVVPAIADGTARFTDNLTAVTILQGLIGLSIGANQPVSQAIVTELSPPENRSKHLSFLMLAWYVGALTAIAAECLLPCEPAAAPSVNKRIPHSVLTVRRKRSLVEPLSKSNFVLLRILDVPNAPRNSSDVLPTGDSGKCDRKSQSAFSSHADLSGISGRDATDAQIRKPTTDTWDTVGNLHRHGRGLGRYCLRSFRPCVGNLFLALRRSVRDAVDVGLFVAESALSDHCTDNGGRDCFCSVAGCVGGSGCGVPVAFELLQYSKNICRGNNDYCSWDRSSNSLQGTYQVLSTTPFVCLQPNLQSVFFRGDTRQSEPFSPASILTSWKIHVTFVVSFPLSIWRYSHSKILVIRCSPHSNYI